MSEKEKPIICERCPYYEPSSMASLLTFVAEDIRVQVAYYIDSAENEDQQLSRMFVQLMIAVFEGPNFRIEAKTALAMVSCFESIWKMGNRELTCSRYPMEESYKTPGSPILCTRKYMMEQTIIFLRALWEESGQNDEQFQTLFEGAKLAHELDFLLR
ncbi:hypothetical protein H6768_00420 [Candidatus Peribacteria bacterium]|nr:hypothetical protein [Candidatus Peribacteria bacterium]